MTPSLASPTRGGVNLRLTFPGSLPSSPASPYTPYSPSSPYTSASHMAPLPEPKLPVKKVDKLHHGLNATACGQLVSELRPGKALSMRQLKDIMAAVCDSKRKHDVRCTQLGCSLHTLEQHLYSFLSERYRGQAAMVQEMAQAVYRAITRWSAVECDAEVYAKMIQNKLPETFPAVLDTVKAQLDIILKKLVNERNAGERYYHMDRCYREALQSGIAVSDCDYVIRHIYNDDDCDVMMDRLSRNLCMPEPGSGQEEEEQVVRYRDMQQAVMRMQVECMGKYLAQFVALFESVDTDGDGILSGPELLELLESLVAAVPAANLKLAEAARLPLLVDLRGRASATFSQCTGLFEGIIAALHEDP
eukprot:TRINITY_DN21306_c0_g1_i1.p1 TRINITY_DN21306_c0_g1~~TRINITY_DN21306_c0_g1_i1.p1  ORF type:complete len:361 (-),score=92.24 TRINITY_DN21306_c0_g1_i1:129-1211(-)